MGRSYAPSRRFEMLITNIVHAVCINQSNIKISISLANIISNMKQHDGYHFKRSSNSKIGIGKCRQRMRAR